MKHSFSFLAKIISIELHVNAQIVLIGVWGPSLSLLMVMSSGETMKVHASLIFGCL